MSSVSDENLRFKITVCSSIFLLALLILPASTSAQLGNNGIDDDPASGIRSGNNTIVGRVIFPPGRRPERRFTVRLSSVRVGEFSTMTDDNGVFTFRRLREGSYFLMIEAGKEYLPAQETVDLYDNRARTITVQIDLRLRPNVTAKPSVIDAALANVPKAAIELYKKGVASAAAGDAKKAIEAFKAALAVYPRFLLALNELSALYVNINELEKAQEALATALSNEPNNATLRLNYGYVLLLREQFADAERELRQAVRSNDNSPAAHSYLGLVLTRLGRFDEAEKELRRAIGLGGGPGITAHRYLGALYGEKGEFGKAIAELETYIKLAPNARDVEQVRAKIKELQARLQDKKN